MKIMMNKEDHNRMQLNLYCIEYLVLNEILPRKKKNSTSYGVNLSVLYMPPTRITLQRENHCLRKKYLSPFVTL